MLLSVIIPAYNEERTVETVLKTVLAVPVEKEVIAVNDKSSDNTGAILDKIKNETSNLLVIHKEKNEGKGAAIKTALAHITGDIVIIQDADLELDPNEYPKLIEPFEKHNADIVFGSRFQMAGSRRVFKTHRYLANRILTVFSNLMSGMYITDMETCYKLFKREIIMSFDIESKRFGIEPELTAKAAKGNWRFYEVPVTYNPRTHLQGKKIGIKDGLTAIYDIIRFNLFE
ncbi:glycosyltransferase family 2 protein [Patescibacteria group bacterium]